VKIGRKSKNSIDTPKGVLSRLPGIVQWYDLVNWNLVLSENRLNKPAFFIKNLLKH